MKHGMLIGLVVIVASLLAGAKEVGQTVGHPTVSVKTNGPATVTPNSTEEKSYYLTMISPNPDGIYHVGEKVNFYPQAVSSSVIVMDGKIRWKIIKNMMTTVAEGEFTTDVISACASYIADEPCCLECKMTFYPADGAAPVSASLGAAVDPFNIRAGMPAPADFDSFWDKQLQRLADVPLKSTVTPVKSGNFECFDVQVDCVDQIPVSGLLMRSAATYKKKCPVVICFHGAEAKSARPENAFAFVEQDFLVLDINGHGLPNFQAPEFYVEKNSHELKGYTTRNLASGDPAKVYFAGMFCRVKRAIDFMTSLPEWDGRNLILYGSSQGAMQCFAGAYLDKRVSAMASGVPAGCDFGGGLVGRLPGWPVIFYDPGKKIPETVIKTASYFDSANFASHIKVPGLFAIGLGDSICPPSSSFAAYNNYAGTKSMIIAPWMKHAVEPAIARELIKFVIDQAHKNGAK